MTKLPQYPRQELSIDFFGPVPNNNELLVIIDKHSRFPFAIEVKPTSAKYVLPALDTLFSCMGIPKEIGTEMDHHSQVSNFQNFVNTSV